MFNVGGPEIVVILLVALMILGPEQLPKAMRAFGTASSQVRKVSSGLQDEVRKAMLSLDAPATPVAEAEPTEVGARRPSTTTDP